MDPVSDAPELLTDQLGTKNPTPTDYGSDTSNPLAKLVTGWRACIKRGLSSKKEFQEVADECMAFFASKDMWDEKLKKTFFSRKMNPTFRMIMNKAFELVAIYGPVLYHKNPVRRCTPREPVPLSPDMFGITPEFLQFQQASEQYSQMMAAGPQPGPDGNPMPPPPPPQLPPSLQGPVAFQQQQQQFMMFQQAQQSEQQKVVADNVRANLMERVLNYTPNEMPGGGLRRHAQLAITESLIKGRGCLWTTPHQKEGSPLLMIVDEYDSVDNLIIDPDATRIEEANWIARRCIHPTWYVEKEYGWPKGSLKGKGMIESADSQERSRLSGQADLERIQGGTTDLMVYYKVWSRMGCGARLTGVNADHAEVLEEVLGENCYLVVAPDIPYFLNLPPDLLASAADDEITSAAAWPVPYYADERWPVTCLDYYTQPGKCWPISPLAPGLGELKFLNVMTSHMANRIWSSSRDFIAVVKGAADEVKKVLKEGEDQAVMEMQANEGKISEQIQFLQQPMTNVDAWRIVEDVSNRFDKRVGLSELLYGLTENQMRSATEANAKQNQVSVRPDYMAEKVEEWLTEVSRREGMAIRWFMQPQDVAPIIGDAGAMLWQQYVMDSDVAKVALELEYRIEESSARKPNKDRDVQNINQALQAFGPFLQQFAMQTGNTGPFNAMMESWGKAADCDVQSMLLPPMPPPPPPMPPPEGQGEEGGGEGKKTGP